MKLSRRNCHDLYEIFTNSTAKLKISSKLDSKLENTMAKEQTATDLLGLDESEDEQVFSHSDNEEETRASHRTKRRRVTKNDDDESDAAEDSDDDSADPSIDPRFAGKLGGAAFAKDSKKTEKSRDGEDGSDAEKDDAEEDDQDDDEADDEEKNTKDFTNPSKLKPLTPAQLLASKAATAKTGVVYLSKIPPFMKPQKVRTLLGNFGKIGRVFLSPEDPKSHSKRVKFGGNKKRMFVEGWVEFMDKKEARLCAETLNCTSVGGKKGSFYYDDIWNMRYLKKYKWHHLQAQIGKSPVQHLELHDTLRTATPPPLPERGGNRIANT